MSRSYLMRRPQDDDDSDHEVIHAKPINDRYAKHLGSAYKGKDFIRGSEKSQQQFYGAQTVMEDGSEATSSRSLTHDERNKLSAKILKAEMKGNKELADKLKRQLESGVMGNEPSGSKDTVVLMKMDKRSGAAIPAKQSDRLATIGDRQRGTVDAQYRQDKELKDMVAEEKSTSAEDQLSMFGRAAKMCSGNKVDDDWVVDDNLMSHPKKRRHTEKDDKKSNQKRIKDHKLL
jgi:hypothetical protein